MSRKRDRCRRVSSHSPGALRDVLPGEPGRQRLEPQRAGAVALGGGYREVRTEHDLAGGRRRPVQDDAAPRGAAGDHPAWKTGQSGLCAGGRTENQPEAHGSGPPGGGGDQGRGQQQGSARCGRGADNGLQQGVALAGAQHLIDGRDECVDVIEAQQVRAEVPTGGESPQPGQASRVLRADHRAHPGVGEELAHG